jgi:hypothetical protein
MAQIADAWLARQECRWLRPDAHRWFRPDAGRWRQSGDASLPHERKAEHAATISDGFDGALPLDLAIARLRSRLAAENVLLKARRVLELHKKYNPDQPRVPSGSPEGGRWASGDGNTPVRLTAADKGPLSRGSRVAIALAIAKRLIDAFRSDNFLRNLLGEKDGTVTVTEINGEKVFGVNSTSPNYTDKDFDAAVALRDTLLEKYPDTMTTENVGHKPNDALFHAETTALLRALGENGGTLEGKSLIVFSDNAMCRSCELVLPKIGLEIGDPTVTFVGPGGSWRRMKGGKWLE